MATVRPPPHPEPPLVEFDQLLSVFRSAEKPRERWRIGTEAEKVGVDASTGTAVPYEGPRGVTRVFEELARQHGWQAEREYDGGPIIALERAGASVTLEPGAQLELSGAPLEDIHQVRAECDQHFAELSGISQELGLTWLGIGFHPFAAQAELPWVPKQRYAIMREYLPPRGSGALDMMRRTATVQANFDYDSEEDALTKLGVLLRISPLVHCMTANSPLVEGKPAPYKSVRGHVWLNMDPSRSGLIPALWSGQPLGYRDYVEWALDAGMFLFKRGSEVIANSGQTFRSFMNEGYRGHRATMSDWKLHLNTLFPEVRLKNTLEVRGCDMLPNELLCAVPALFTGVLYDNASLQEAERFSRRFSLSALQAARPEWVRTGLAGQYEGVPLRELALELLDIARRGLERRSIRNTNGELESVYLKPLQTLVAEGRTPADSLLEQLPSDPKQIPASVIAATRLVG